MSIENPTRLPRLQENNPLKRFTHLFYELGAITSNPSHKDERSLQLRRKRAVLYHQFQSAGNDERHQIIQETRERQKIEHQYLTQGQVSVEGEQAKYVVLTPPNPDKYPEKVNMPPIILIPGISNDVDSVGNLAKEIAYMGRSVYVFGFPDATIGKVSPKFTSEVEQDTGYTPHTKFFTEAINQLVQPDATIELWGFSTGAAIVSHMLALDPAMRQRTTDAVLISPASVTDQSIFSLAAGVISEGANVLRQGKNMLYYDNVLPQKNPDANKKRIFDAILRRVRKDIHLWEFARVRDGGTITAVIGDSDHETKGYRVADKMPLVNPQLHVIRSKGSHVRPIIEPTPVIQAIFDQQEAHKKVVIS